jgi:hypothetical protein
MSAISCLISAQILPIAHVRLKMLRVTATAKLFRQQLQIL